MPVLLMYLLGMNVQKLVNIWSAKVLCSKLSSATLYSPIALHSEFVQG